MSNKISVVFVVGPTASGKTGLGAAIAKELDGEVISADSMQIYKDMRIASAAPFGYEDTLGVPHHLVEFLEYGENFTVADYVQAAREKIFNIKSRGKLPVVVGGTGLYINTLADNIEFLEQATNLELRNRLTRQLEEIGAEDMLSKLGDIDPKTAARLHPSDTRRIIRAFEVYELTGLTLTQQNERSRQNDSPFEPIMIGINYRDRARLYDRINRRVDIMCEKGLVDEARLAFQKDLKSGAAQAIGHKELFDYFRGIITLEEALENLKQATRRYAKRQLTWFNRDERINWFYPDEDPQICDGAIKLVKEVLNK